MASQPSPCVGFKARVLHFKVKIAPCKEEKWREKAQKNQLSFHFVDEGKLFIKKSSFEKFNLIFFTVESVLKCNQGSEVFAEFSGTFCTRSMAKRITFLKGNICNYNCFINVLNIFLWR